MNNAGQFARKINNGTGTDIFHFGLTDVAEIAKTIRYFADQVEQGNFIVTRVQAGSVALPDEFTTQAIMIEYAVKEHKPEESAS
jgi:hypothetical protein